MSPPTWYATRRQSFDDGRVFKGSEWQMLKQIGHAMPPMLAHAAARMLRAVLAAIEGNSDRVKSLL